VDIQKRTKGLDKQQSQGLINVIQKASQINCEVEKKNDHYDLNINVKVPFSPDKGQETFQKGISSHDKLPFPAFMPRQLSITEAGEEAKQSRAVAPETIASQFSQEDSSSLSQTNNRSKENPQ